MKTFQKIVSIKTKGMFDFVEINTETQKVVDESEVKNGIIFLNSLHTTSALILQENDPTIHRDLTHTLEKLVPVKGKYEHLEEGVENATAHLRANLLGTFVTLPLIDGKMQLGVWQSVYLVELFEPRERKVVVTVIGE